jgi:transketolase
VFFLGRENFPKAFGAKSYQLNKASVLLDHQVPGKNVVLLTAGSLIQQALTAAEKIVASGAGVTVIDAVSMNHIDVATIKAALEKADGKLVTVEDHQLIGGFGAIACQALLNAGVKVQAKCLGVKGEFGRSAYNAIELYRLHGIDAGAIVEAARAL